MISTLRKFPWYMTDRITVRQRHAVYEACVSLLRCLQWAMKERKHEGILTPQLYRRLWTSGMLCHGFTVTMRDSIASIVDLPEHRMREFNMPQFGEMWRHIYSLVPKPGSPLDLIEVNFLVALSCCLFFQMGLPLHEAVLSLTMLFHSGTSPSSARRLIAP